MSTDANKAIVRRFNDEFISHGNMETFRELLAPDVVNHSAPPGLPPGAAGVRQLFDVYRTAFPDLVAELYDQVAEGNKVVTRKAFHGTHLGPLMTIPPTGKRVKIDVIDIVRVVDGKITEHWNVVDQMGLMQQLGLVPTLGAQESDQALVSPVETGRA